MTGFKRVARYKGNSLENPIDVMTYAPNDTLQFYGTAPAYEDRPATMAGGMLVVEAKVPDQREITDSTNGSNPLTLAMLLHTALQGIHVPIITTVPGAKVDAYTGFGFVDTDQALKSGDDVDKLVARLSVDHPKTARQLAAKALSAANIDSTPERFLPKDGDRDVSDKWKGDY